MFEMMLSKRIIDDLGVKFLGEVNNLITYANISTHFGVTEGYLNTTTQADKWLHFILDEKELYVSKVAIRNSISWHHLYISGLVYGTDDDGLNPTHPPTNQYRTITLNGKLYKCRLLKGCDEGEDPFGINLGYDLVGTQQSEWSRLFYPIVTDDPNVSSYTGPMLASYTEADLQMRWIDEVTTPGSCAWCQERHYGDISWRVLRGYLGPSYLRRYSNWDVSAFSGWRCVLERV